MEPNGKIIHWTKIAVFVGSVLICVFLVAFIYYLINVWLPNQETKKTELRIQEIEELLKMNLR